ncbi:PREDICTED: uncharacterized protein LOC108618037 [Drosophila arizonae]|uniref:Uncharacterized protein LOC108618037 n=1 Tax=Drosophila arizonae TaxID=7263 RepID=A0ABM1PQE6_DROAR|nr:PREDICTED: uncharacterized protein LOC108618037 [Drosophila arizonae]
MFHLEIGGGNEMQQLDSGLGMRNGTSKSDLPVADEYLSLYSALLSVLDCQVGDWGAWSECDKSCGAGMMTRTRQVLQAAQNGGKHCPSLLQKRACQGYRCHGHRDKKILREMALLLPAALTRNHRTNESSDSRHNLHSRYRDSYKHNRDHEYCVEFEVIKASKACHKLPPYNLMLEGDRITVRCDLEALVQDKDAEAGVGKAGNRGATTTTTTTHKTLMAQPYLTEEGEENSSSSNSNDNDDDNEDEQEQEQEQEEDEEDTEEDDAQNMLDSEANGDAEAETEAEAASRESYGYKHQRPSSHHPRAATSKRSANAAAPMLPPALQPQQQQLLLNYHCRGEGLSGRTTRWSALPAPSCRGKWLRLTIGPPKKCNHAQFIFV